MRELNELLFVARWAIGLRNRRSQYFSSSTLFNYVDSPLIALHPPIQLSSPHTLTINPSPRETSFSKFISFRLMASPPVESSWVPPGFTRPSRELTVFTAPLGHSLVYRDPDLSLLYPRRPVPVPPVRISIKFHRSGPRNSPQ